MARGTSRYTAQAQYGMVGFGAGPAGSTVAAPGVADVANGLTGAAAMTPAPNGSPLNLVMPSGVRVLEDPTFWMVATLGAVIFLAAYSAS